MFLIKNKSTGNFVDFDSRRGGGGIDEMPTVRNYMKYNFKSDAEEDVKILEQICSPEKYEVVDA